MAMGDYTGRKTRTGTIIKPLEEKRELVKRVNALRGEGKSVTEACEEVGGSVNDYNNWVRQLGMPFEGDGRTAATARRLRTMKENRDRGDNLPTLHTFHFPNDLATRSEPRDAEKAEAPNTKNESPMVCLIGKAADIRETLETLRALWSK